MDRHEDARLYCGYYKQDSSCALLAAMDKTEIRCKVARARRNQSVVAIWIYVYRDEGGNGMISVDYGARWPIKFVPFPVDEVPELYDRLIDFASRGIVIETWRKMDDVKRCKLIEKVTIEFCKETSPKRNYGVGQAEIRGGIIEAIDITEGGAMEWLTGLSSPQ
ncbi:hypothetical protein [Paenibacillus sp. J22TS3]|uniref:hypothetical protein n=1 Tax=Paenibacillus sp. J22TS3 TaxID=2807192 RepID=UPI001B1C5F18|nr:hypothetical protein [Paenibacillus sp. J22TS3]GIP21057.1 hypothetical protein J22TS3_13320 [Paenibacillus sp. J22TS3]